MSRLDKQPAYLPTRRSLVENLAGQGDQRRWQEFFRTYHQLIFNTARRAGLRQAEAEEVVQETLITVSQNIGKLQYDPETGSFKGWLLTIVRWRVADQYRQRDSELADISAGDKGQAQTSAMDRLPQPETGDFESVWEQEWREQLFQAALVSVRQQFEPAQWQVFDCYVQKAWPARKVAAELGVNIAQVYLIKSRVGSALKAEVRRLEAGKG